MINFTVGPVQSSEKVREIGSHQVPYFRTPEFSSVIKDNEEKIKKFAGADEKARVVFLTGSGTASMEAAVINTLTKNDTVLIINGGSFGQRFVDLCQIYKIPHTVIALESGQALSQQHLQKYEGQGYTAFLVNIHETSTGVHYDLDLIHQFCKRNHLFLIVDAISSFLADPINMQQSDIDVLIAGSQKALACPPGISLLILSENALSRIHQNDTKCMYLDLKSALKDGERGQTPFTPAVSILLQINERLHEIAENGDVEREIAKVQALAKDFRSKLKGLPFEIASEALSNAVTPLHPTTASAYDIFTILKDEYQIWVCPNGGDLKDYIFRVGHIGNLSTQDNDILIAAFQDMKRRAFI